MKREEPAFCLSTALAFLQGGFAGTNISPYFLSHGFSNQTVILGKICRIIAGKFYQISRSAIKKEVDAKNPGLAARARHPKAIGGDLEVMKPLNLTLTEIKLGSIISAHNVYYVK
jgi:hypothetical protein